MRIDKDGNRQPVLANGDERFFKAVRLPHLSPQLRTEDLPQAAIIVANMVDTFLDAQKRTRSDVDMELEHPPVISLKRKAQGGSHVQLED